MQRDAAHKSKTRNIGMGKQNFFNLHDMTQGIARELAPGINTRVFPGDHAMLSVVRLAPKAVGKLHAHPEEQWGVLLEGDAVRTQAGVDIEVRAGDFWRTPGTVEHSILAGEDGALILDVFSPPRKSYEQAGAGFGGAEVENEK